MKTTTIVVNGERWDVPRGFGVAYKAEAAQQSVEVMRGRRSPGDAIQDIQDALRLVGYEASVAAIADWPLRKRVEALVHALNEHARASDCPIRRHPRPGWMPDPWQGPQRGEGPFGGSGPTRLS